MKSTLLTVTTLAIGVATPFPLLAQCCGGGTSTRQDCTLPGMSGTADAAHGAHAVSSTAVNSTAAKPVFAEPVQSIFDNYTKVQTALVSDSLEGVANAGAAIIKALPAAASEKLPGGLNSQAESLAKAQILAASRRH